MKPHLVMNSKIKKENNGDVNETVDSDDKEAFLRDDEDQKQQLKTKRDTELVNLKHASHEANNLQITESFPAAICMQNKVINDTNISNVRMVRASLLKVLDDNLMAFTKDAREILAGTLANLEDMDMIMAQSKRLFINLIFSSYLTSHSCQEQLSWLGMSGVHLANLIFSETNRHFAKTKLNLFNGDNLMLDLYLAYAESLRQNWLAPCSKADYVKLFMFYPGKLDLTMRLKIVASFETKANMLNIPLDEAYDMGQTLEAMSVLLDQDGISRHLLCHAEQKGPQIDHIIPMRYSSAEEMWLTNTRDELLSAMMTIPHGPILNLELENIYKYGKVMRKDVVRVVNKMMEKRMWSSYLSLEQFRDLPHNEQSLLVRSSHKMLCTLIAAKVDGRTIDGDNLVLSPQEMASSGELRRLSTMVCDMNVIFGKLPPEWNKYRKRLHNALSVPDGKMRFFALISLVLFSTACLPPTRVSSKPMRRFHALKRWLDVCMNRRFGSEYEDVLYPVFRDVRTMSDMLPSSEYLM